MLYLWFLSFPCSPISSSSLSLSPPPLSLSFYISLFLPLSLSDRLSLSILCLSVMGRGGGCCLLIFTTSQFKSTPIHLVVLFSRLSVPALAIVAFIVFFFVVVVVFLFLVWFLYVLVNYKVISRTGPKTERLTILCPATHETDGRP